MAYLSANWSNLLEPGLRKVFDGAYKEFQSNLPVLFNIMTSQKAVEHDLNTDEKSVWDQFTGDIKFDDEVEGYKTDYTHDEFTSGKKFERKLVDDDQYGVIERRTRLMSLGASRRKERDGASVFNNSFSSSFTGGDGVALCSSAHPSKQDSAYTRSNVGVLPFTDGNVEVVRQLMVQQKTGTREVADVQPDMLIVPLALERQAWEIINTKGKVDTANNNANFHLGRYKLLVWPNYLISSKAWWMVDSKLMKMFLLWFNRVPVQFFKDRDFGTLISAFAGYMRYSKGWSDWTWVHGNNPA